MSFDQVGLSPELLRAVTQSGFTEPTPVQREAIPYVLAGRDLLAGAQTGTGKTAAFVLPILQRLNKRAAAEPHHKQGYRHPIRVLVLTPTRELAAQVEQSVRTHSRQRPINSTAIYGGVGFAGQVTRLRHGPQIVVATPGRLLDHVEQRTIDLSRVEVLVLDEADRMLDMGFIHDIRKILELLPEQRQNLLFSATLAPEIRRLSADFMKDPAFVQVTPNATSAELVRQVVIPVDRSRKRELLSHLVKSGRVYQALVFTRTKHGADRLADQLAEDGITAVAIHGNKSQPQRMRALAAFKANKVAILVATEVAARGLDIESLPHVVNFEMPMVPSDYVHRIGRTGRAGIEGDAISLVCVDEQPLLADIQRLLGHKIEVENVEGFAPDRSIRPQPIRLRSGEGRHQPRPQHSGQQNRTQHSSPPRAAQAQRGNRPEYGARPAYGESRPPKRWNPHRRQSDRPNSLPGERLSRG